MKKGSLNFLNRKSTSLFDTNVQIKDIDNLDLVLDSNTIPESGTAKVRARPTVKHVSLYGDSIVGFAVPTPKVPVLPPVSEPQSKHTGSTERLFNGGLIAVSDPEEGEILIPPPPSVAPPPPPPQFIPPSPQYIPAPQEFVREPDPSVDLARLHPPSMPAPKPPSQIGSIASEELHLASLKPPPMVPPKPPSDTPNLKDSIPINNNINTAQNIPPLPPGEKPQFSFPKTQKTPPPKPVRLYTASSLELLQAGPAPPAPTPSATPASSFNPQTPAKLYNVPKTTVLHSQSDSEAKTQHILLLEDSSGKPVGVHVNGKNPPVKDLNPAQSLGPPTKPMRCNSSGLQLEQDLQVQREDLQETLPNQLPIQTKPNNHAPSKVRMLQEIPAPIKDSPKTEGSPSAQDIRQVKEQQASSGRTRYSPLLNRKLQVLRGHESSGVKEAAASPLALLKAAKERDKQRAVLSRQSSTQSSSSSESTNFSTQPSETRPNSCTVSSNAASFSTEQPKLAATTDPETKAQITQFSPIKPVMFPNPPPSISLLGIGPIKQGEPTLSASLPGQVKDHENVMGIPFIPPPPEFANSHEEDKGPTRTPTPEPPLKSVIPPVKSNSLTNGPSTFPKPASSTNPAPVTASPSTESKIKMPVQIKPKPPPTQAPVQPKIQPPPPPPVQPPTPPKIQPPTPPKIQPPGQTKTQTPALPPPQASPAVSASHATLLSILHKKMLEMDPKFLPTREADPSGDDWNSPLSDDDGVSSPPLKSATKPKSFPIQGQGLDMKELETKMAKKAQNTTAKAPASSKSKQQYGMTFTVRPGTEQPITPLPKAE
ncbi:extensin [Electrophorus electricus]|uniref:extensin n=1 Tax=Electrophorus electricus TaxID=8005 RepID=UPI0015D0ADA1|nr:extensin [Electrophorus electricus]